MQQIGNLTKRQKQKIMHDLKKKAKRLYVQLSQSLERDKQILPLAYDFKWKID